MHQVQVQPVAFREFRRMLVNFSECDFGSNDDESANLEHTPGGATGNGCQQYVAICGDAFGPR